MLARAFATAVKGVLLWRSPPFPIERVACSPREFARSKRRPPITVDRVVYTPREFAHSLGHHQTWVYRQLYKGKIKAITGLGEILIPRSELTRDTWTAPRTYNPDKATYRRPGRPRNAQKKNGGNAVDAQPTHVVDPARPDSDSCVSAGDSSTPTQQKT